MPSQRWHEHCDDLARQVKPEEEIKAGETGCCQGVGNRLKHPGGVCCYLDQERHFDVPTDWVLGLTQSSRTSITTVAEPRTRTGTGSGTARHRRRRQPEPKPGRS